MNTLTIYANQKPIYDIVFSDGFSDMLEAIAFLQPQKRRICIVSESRVAGLYLQELKTLLQTRAAQVIDFVFPEGESSKNLQTVQDLYTCLIEAKFDRRDLLIALGGGVVGDLTGYAAATYLRGIDFIQVPTSLLAQVDSSIGGKTGVDYQAYKNMIGAFHMPRLVYMNLQTLKTLSERQYLSGMGEIIKHGLIMDKDYYHWIQKKRAHILKRDTNTLAALIYRSCEIKGTVVEEDPKEQGIRALLNYGHTIGHAVEKLMNFSLLHGECVALGMTAAAHISLEKGLIDTDACTDIKETISSFGLPVSFTDNCIKDTLGNTQLPDCMQITAATRLDKKMEAGQIKFVLLSPIGHAVIDRSVTSEQISAAAAAIGAR